MEQDHAGHGADGHDPVADLDAAIGGTPTAGGDVAGDPARTSATDSLADLAGTSAGPAAGTDGTGAAGAPGPTGTDELSGVRSQLEERTADLQRVSAEYANYRRRVDRDREGTVTAAKAQVVGELLTVLDDVARAETHGDLTGPFKVVADRLTETLTRVGLEPFGAEGDAFDPAVHEAVAHDTSPEVSGPTVSTVMRRGYRFGERVLRPAMVAVTDADPAGSVTAGAAPGAGTTPDAV